MDLSVPLLTAEQAERVRADFAAERPSVLIERGEYEYEFFKHAVPGLSWRSQVPLDKAGAARLHEDGRIETWTGAFVAPSRWAVLDKPCDTCGGGGSARYSVPAHSEYGVTDWFPCPDCRDGRQVWELRTERPVAQFDVGQSTDGAALIAIERRRQVEAEGWTPDHDAEHTDGALAHAAAAYIFPDGYDHFWPWDESWWKPSPDPIRNLVKAGALIAAEIDRIQGSVLAARCTVQVVPVVAKGVARIADGGPRQVLYVPEHGRFCWLQLETETHQLSLDPWPVPGQHFGVVLREVAA